MLVRADNEYAIAERDFNNGHELKTGQRFGDYPKGPATPSIATARATMLKVYWNWSLVYRELYGAKAQHDFAILHKNVFLGNDGRYHVPTSVEEMK